MPTLPLHLPADAVPADASHRVRSPGGYEQWTFDATSADGNVRLTASFYDGCPLDPRYVRRYTRYRRRPTRVRPPVPADYPAVHATLLERGRVVARIATDFPPGTCEASTDALDVRIGPNRATRDAEGNIRLALSGTFAAELEFRPASSAKLAVAPVASGNGHYQLIGQPPVAVRGEIRTSAASGSPQNIAFVGHGTHEHRFGTTPLLTPARRRLTIVLLVATVLLVLAARILGPSDLHDKSQPKTVAYTADVVLHGRWMLPRDMVGGPARKPPLYNWVGAPFVVAFGWREWVLKIPAMLAGVGAVTVSVVTARRLLAAPQLGLDREFVDAAACVAGIICVANYPIMKLAYLARPDMPLVAFLCGGWALATVALTSPMTRWPLVLGFWACVAGAGLSKGPPMVLPILYAILAAKCVGGSWSSLKRLRFELGLPLALACVGGWAWAAHTQDPAHFRNVLIGEEILGRFSEGEPLDPYRDPKAMWLVPAWFVTKFAPWSLFVAVAVFSIHPRRWLSHPLTPAILWVALLIVFFSIPEGKRIDYLAPTYPVASILAAYGLVVVLRRYGVTPVRVAVAALVLVVVFIDYQWRRSPEAVGREGERIKSFAREVTKVAGEDRIVFTSLGFHPLQTLLGRHETQPVTYGDLARPGWAIMPVADVTNVRPVVISEEIPQIKVVANAVTLIHERRSGRLGLYKRPLNPGPATTTTAPSE